MKINNKLFDALEENYSNGCGVREGLKLEKVNEKDFVNVLKEYVKWEVKEYGESEGWFDLEDKKDIALLKKAGIDYENYED